VEEITGGLKKESRANFGGRQKGRQSEGARANRDLAEQTLKWRFGPVGLGDFIGREVGEVYPG